MDVKFQTAFDVFVDKLKQDQTTRGILFFGSVQQGKETPSSDLDFYIVVHGNEGWNFKRRVNSVPVEAYFLPSSQWMNLINESPHILRAFATGTVVYDTCSCLAELVAYSQKIFDKKPVALSDLQKANWRITLTEIGADLEGILHEGINNAVFSGWAVAKAIEGDCALSQIWADKTEKLADQLYPLHSELRVWCYKMSRQFF